MKKLFGKRALALLTTMAILVSLVAMLGGLSMTSGAAYEPKRAVTFTVSEGAQQTCLMLEDAFKIAAGQTVTVKGYYNVYEINGGSFNILGTQATQAATDGWVAFEKEYAVPHDAQWKDFGFWQASGKFALADITFENALGEVIYDMAKDAALSAGTYNFTKAASFQKQSIWYLMGAYGTGSTDTAAVEVVVDAAYVEPYTPKRTISMTAGGTQINGKIFLYNTDQLGSGKEVTVKGYFKIDNYAEARDDHNIITPAGAIKGNCDWTPFEKTFTTGSGNKLSMEFWYAQGTVSFADVTIYEGATCIYDMTADEELVAGTYDINNWKLNQSLFYFGYYQAMSETTYTIDPVYTEPYAPKRTISMTTAGTQINGKICLYYTSNLGAGKEITVKGYYKIDNYAAARDDHKIWSPDGKEHFGNCDWTSFEKTFTSGNGHNLCLEYWYAQGTISLADIAIYEGETRIYDMTTDENLVAGTYDNTNWKTDQGLWYFGFYSAIDQATYTIDPIYVPETYNPTRVISMTTAGTQINGKIYLYNSNLLGSGKQVVVKGYYKVEGYTEARDDHNITTPGGSVKGNCDWTPFEKTFTTGSGNNLSLEFWYAQGTVSFADVTIKEVDGDYIYDMATDEDLVAGTYDSSNWAINQGLWYFGFYSAIDQATYTIGEKAEGGLVIIPPPYDPEVVELPEIPNLIVADKNGYTPNRAFAIIKGVHKSPKVTYGVFADETNYAVAGNKYYVFLKYGAGDMDGVEATISINGTVVKTLTADTEAWETLLDENGKPYSFDGVEVDDIVSIVFQVKGEGTGNFAIADFIIADQTGKIVYSLANDKTMHMEGDMRYVTNGYWKGDPYVAEVEGPTLFPIQTKVETYKPSAYISMTQNDKKKGTTAEAFLFLRTNNAKFTAGQKYTIKGMILVDIDAGYGAWGNASMSWGDSTGAAKIDGGYMLGTNGAWLPFVYPDGSPVTFMGTPEEDWLKINLFKTYGTIALADIQILDAQGNVVYDMATDEALKALAGDYSGNVVTLGDVFLAALYNNGVGEVWFAEAAQSNTETSKQIPTFEESVEVPAIECDHNFEDGVCTECGEEDPDYVPECDHNFEDGVCTECGEEDPDYVPECDHNFEDGVCTECGEEDPDYVPECDHNFEDGVCTECGEEDPNYNPGGDDPIEPPAQTGDENMFIVMALGTLAVISLAALTLNKKFHA